LPPPGWRLTAVPRRRHRDGVVALVHLLAGRLGAAPAILAMAGLGFAGLLWIWARLSRAPV